MEVEVPLDSQPEEAAAAPPLRTVVRDDSVGLLSSSKLLNTDELPDNIPALKNTSWFVQFYYVMIKNALLLYRRPILMTAFVLSSVLSVVIAGLVAADSDNAIFVEFDECGTVPYPEVQKFNYTDQSNVQFSLNEPWRDGIAVTLMALGPMVNAIIVFLIIHEEIASQLLGVLRALGLRDSVYWMSWYVPFTFFAFVNALLGAITAHSIPVHAFESIYFGGVLGSLFFLQLALIAASFFVAALIGTAKKGANWVILVFLVAVWVPFFVLSASSRLPYSSSSFYSESPSGLFWQNVNTISWRSNYTYPPNSTVPDISYSTCNIPIVSEFQGTFYKTDAERALVTNEEFFVGCYSLASWPSQAWSSGNGGQGFALVAYYFFPYFHFTSIWGAFVGFTSMPGREFTTEEASISPEALAIQALPSPPDESKALGTTLFPQGSTIKRSSYYEQLNCYESPCVQKNTCPLSNMTGYNFCDYLSSCDHAVEPVPAESPSVGASMGHLFLLSLIYLVLTGYFAQVFPGANGKPQKFYFFLLPSYWFGARMAEPSLDQSNDAATSGRQASFRASISGGGGVIVDSVKKVYGSFEAIKGVSLKMARGEVTALLGHNGAGKTTLSHVLSCEISPSEGDVYVYGHSVTKDPYAVRRMVGLCKQDDYLWPDLSAKEHLELFAGLRGVKADERADIVQKWLESVDLAEVQLQYSNAYSGGMKRRLSVALATIGDRPLIILDEPTTGMDPVSRRFVWRHIDEIKEGRVILLTTHAMEEADLLADEVAIMRKGELAALGSPLQLKHDHGSALQFSILVDKSDVNETGDMVNKFFADAMDWITTDLGAAGNISVNIKRIRQGEEENGVDVALLSSFVAWLESDDSPVTEYGFSNSSLEEVFLKITSSEEEHKEIMQENQDEKRGCCSKSRCFAKKQDVAVSESNNAEDAGEVAENQDESIVGVPEVGSFEDIATFHPKLSVIHQMRTLFGDFSRRAWTGKASIGNYILFGGLLFGNICVGLALANGGTPVLAFTMPTVTLTLMLLCIIGPIYSDRAEGLFYLMRTQGMLAESFLSGSSLYALAVGSAYSFLVLSLLFATPIFRSPEICEPYICDPITGFCNYNPSCYNNGWGDPQEVTETTRIYNFYDEYEGQSVELSAIREPGGYGMIFGTIVLFALSFPGAVMSSAYLPGYKFPLVLITFICLLVGIWPMVMLLKTLDDEALIDCSNATSPDNVCDSDFNITDANEDFVNCVGLEVNSDHYQSFCVPPHAALLPQFGVFQALTMTYSAKIRFISEPEGYVREVLIPQIQGANCDGDVCQFPYAKELYGLNLVFMLVGAVLLLILGYFMASILAFPSGPILKLRQSISQTIHSLRCRQAPTQETLDGKPTEELEEVRTERKTVREIIRPLLSEPESEATEVEGFSPALNYSVIPREEIPPVMISRLRKVYPALGGGNKPKVALKSLDMHVPKGQVLGFLGKNGAGKTTALKMLAGAHDPSGGVGLVAGYDSATERVQVFERLGSCPQFDVIWKGRTVQSHLEFFARMKGLPNANVRSVSQAIASAVGLGSPEVYHRNAGALSGGMRRRLSIAMSLVGSPAVVILDEPTTGLDPSTRNSIWALVNSFATQERSMIITTHMMIEADTLCNRIAIVAQGELKVIGSSQHLKDKFGSGYLLQLNLVKSTPENQISAMTFVQTRLHPDAILATKQAKTLHINLPRDLDLQKVFAALYSPEAASEGRINQFLLSQSSLEDVFIALGD